MNRDVVVALIAALGSGTLVTALLKVLPRSPESRKTTIELAEGAALVQSTVLKDINAARERQQGEIDDLRNQLAALREHFQARENAYELERAELREKLAHAEADKETLERKNAALVERVRALEDDLAELRGEIKQGPALDEGGNMIERRETP